MLKVTSQAEDALQGLDKSNNHQAVLVQRNLPIRYATTVRHHMQSPFLIVPYKSAPTDLSATSKNHRFGVVNQQVEEVGITTASRQTQSHVNLRPCWTRLKLLIFLFYEAHHIFLSVHLQRKRGRIDSWIEHGYKTMAMA